MSKITVFEYSDDEWKLVEQSIAGAHSYRTGLCERLEHAAYDFHRGHEDYFGREYYLSRPPRNQHLRDTFIEEVLGEWLWMFDKLRLSYDGVNQVPRGPLLRYIEATTAPVLRFAGLAPLGKSTIKRLVNKAQLHIIKGNSSCLGALRD